MRTAEIIKRSLVASAGADFLIRRHECRNETHVQDIQQIQMSALDQIITKYNRRDFICLSIAPIYPRLDTVGNIGCVCQVIKLQIDRARLWTRVLLDCRRVPRRFVGNNAGRPHGRVYSSPRVSRAQAAYRLA